MPKKLLLLLSPSKSHKNSSSSRDTYVNTRIPMGALFEYSLHPPIQYLGSICWVLGVFVLRGPLDRGPCPPALSAYFTTRANWTGLTDGPLKLRTEGEAEWGEEGRTQSWVIRGKEYVCLEWVLVCSGVGWGGRHRMSWTFLIHYRWPLLQVALCLHAKQECVVMWQVGCVCVAPFCTCVLGGCLQMHLMCGNCCLFS